MACPAIHTGQEFLSATLTHIDCQAQVIGSYGFGALSDPGSTVFLALTAVLTIFIALFGIRLMFGAPLHGRELIDNILKIGIVLTLATSWPAWRVIGYDLALDGPAEVAQAIGVASGLPGSADNNVLGRLQRADDGIVVATIYGTGRLTGGAPASKGLGDSFQGIALADQLGLGFGRSAFLVGTIAPYTITRIGTGILLAIAPLMAGLLLFSGLQSMFYGWTKGLIFCALGNFAILLTQGIELAVLEPWLADVLVRREAGAYTPSAPTELLVLAFAFCVLSLGILFLAARVVFHPSSAKSRIIGQFTPVMQSVGNAANRVGESLSEHASRPRALLIAQSVETAVRREGLTAERALNSWSPRAVDPSRPAQATAEATGPHQSSLLGDGYLRTGRRTSAATQRRDKSR
jgi:type IV secretion system protein VirB6